MHSQVPPSSSHLGEMRAGTQSPSGVLATLPVDGLAGSATQEAWEGTQRSSDIPLARDVLVASWGRYPRTGGEDLKTSTHYLGAECVLHQLGAAPNSRAKWEREEPTPLVKKTLESSDFQGTAHLTTAQAYAHRAFERTGDPTHCGQSWEGTQRPWEQTRRLPCVGLANHTCGTLAGGVTRETQEETSKLHSTSSGLMLSYVESQKQKPQDGKRDTWLKRSSNVGKKKRKR